MDSGQDSGLAHFLEDLCQIEKPSEIKIPPFLLCQSLVRVNRTYTITSSPLICTIIHTKVRSVHKDTIIFSMKYVDHF